VWDREAALLPTSYVTAVFRAGAVPVLLPVLPDGQESALSAVDALVIAGGADVDPASYGHTRHPEVQRTRPKRDSWETRLVHAALRRDLPVLGVCRGAQILNVALGGSLHQHLPDLVEHDEHQPAPGVFGRSKIRLRPGSRTAGVLGEEVAVPCYHHQSLDSVADALDVAGHAEDGTVEAVELPTHRFAVGVQWHPEEDLDDLRLFEALIAAAARDEVLGGKR
jgi:anthranilate synthase component 2/putative glutamine amidotransferase